MQRIPTFLFRSRVNRMKRVITFCSGFWNAVISDWGSHGFLVNNAPSLNQNQHFSIFSIQTTILVFNIDKACEYQKSVLHFYKALKKYLHKFNKLWQEKLIFSRCFAFS